MDGRSVMRRGGCAAVRVVGERAVGEKGGKRNAETRGNPGAAQRRLTLQCCAVGTAVATQ